MSVSFWTRANTVTSVLVDVSVLFAALAAVIKFRVLNMLGRRYRSELACTHHALPAGDIVFLGDYIIHNTGDRPILLTRVTLRLHAARRDGAILMADETQTLAERVYSCADSTRKGLFRIGAGERSIFPMRCQLPKLDSVVFLSCRLSWSDGREPAPYNGIYVHTPGTPIDDNKSAGSLT